MLCDGGDGKDGPSGEVEREEQEVQAIDEEPSSKDPIPELARVGLARSISTRPPGPCVCRLCRHKSLFASQLGMAEPRDALCISKRRKKEREKKRKIWIWLHADSGLLNSGLIPLHYHDILGGHWRKEHIPST
jgi:hypothetical protein